MPVLLRKKAQHVLQRKVPLEKEKERERVGEASAGREQSGGEGRHQPTQRPA